eukprot:SAG25_NODE_175_length_12811_cov_5.011721_7_plen_39_part_00
MDGTSLTPDLAELAHIAASGVEMPLTYGAPPGLFSAIM